MGKRRGFAGPTSAAFITWVFLVRRHRPRILVHENVVGFDIRALADLLADLYDYQHLELDPRALGLPVARRRRYTVFTLKSHVRLARSLSDLPKLFGLGVSSGTGLEFYLDDSLSCALTTLQQLHLDNFRSNGFCLRPHDVVDLVQNPLVRP